MDCYGLAHAAGNGHTLLQPGDSTTFTCCRMNCVVSMVSRAGVRRL